MARLIVKSPYIKCAGGGNAAGAGGYLRYIGTRERVQKLTDDRPPTRKQEQRAREQYELERRAAETTHAEEE